jgi:hypothetical protein
MNITRDRLRSIGWAFVLALCIAATLALTIRVNAVKSQVQLAERQIVALKRQKIMLETEFLARANQQQLRSLNEVEFGYAAPTPGQYLAGERQLAALGKSAAPDAPAPIRVASAVNTQETVPFAALVNPLTGKAEAADIKPSAASKPADAAARKVNASAATDREVRQP